MTAREFQLGEPEGSAGLLDHIGEGFEHAFEADPALTIVCFFVVAGFGLWLWAHYGHKKHEAKLDADFRLQSATFGTALQAVQRAYEQQLNRDPTTSQPVPSSATGDGANGSNS